MDSLYDAIIQEIDFTLLDNPKGLTRFPLVIVYAPQKPAEIRQGNRTYLMAKSTCMVLEGKEPISMANEDNHLVYLGLSGDLAQKHSPKTAIGKPRSLSEVRALGAAIRRILIDRAKGWTDNRRISMAFNLLLAIQALSKEVDIKPKVVVDACEIMDEEYGYIYGVEDVADRLGVNKAHLIRVFKSAMKMTPGEYLKTVRMENAKHFLVNRELSLDVVAGLTGYANANYFGKVFKKEFGVSPKAYQRTATEKHTVKEKAVPDELFL